MCPNYIALHIQYKRAGICIIRTDFTLMPHCSLSKACAYLQVSASAQYICLVAVQRRILSRSIAFLVVI